MPPQASASLAANARLSSSHRSASWQRPVPSPMEGLSPEQRRSLRKVGLGFWGFRVWGTPSPQEFAAQQQWQGCSPRDVRPPSPWSFASCSRCHKQLQPLMYAYDGIASGRVTLIGSNADGVGGSRQQVPILSGYRVIDVAGIAGGRVARYLVLVCIIETKRIQLLLFSRKMGQLVPIWQPSIGSLSQSRRARWRRGSATCRRHRRVTWSQPLLGGSSL
jgi:hypothetical protein